MPLFKKRTANYGQIKLINTPMLNLAHDEQPDFPDIKTACRWQVSLW